ncbi:hypothetical protein AAFF_G00434740 [Aldrovandia affinis]|uniref:Uncharacterized protein n=1 Tax=Aldrovandia affinis TaxID=143900 RepID=A0AAD7WIE1_9TELE|nr:hypothetical protein AAFF_G00434740 [Aldrovandia affinis]
MSALVTFLQITSSLGPRSAERGRLPLRPRADALSPDAPRTRPGAGTHGRPSVRSSRAGFMDAQGQISRASRSCFRRAENVYFGGTKWSSVFVANAVQAVAQCALSRAPLR